MQTFFQLVSVIVAGTSFGIIFWTLLLLAFFFVSGGSGGGFINIGPTDIADFIKTGLMVGGIHGFLISIGVCMSKPGELLGGTLFGFVVVEVGFVIAIVAIAYWLWRSWPPHNECRRNHYKLVRNLFFDIHSTIFLPWIFDRKVLSICRLETHSHFIEEKYTNL